MHGKLKLDGGRRKENWGKYEELWNFGKTHIPIGDQDPEIFVFFVNSISDCVFIICYVVRTKGVPLNGEIDS